MINKKFKVKKIIYLFLIFSLIGFLLVGCNFDKELKLARELKKEGKFNESIKEYNKILKKDKKNIDAYTELFKIYDYKDDYDNAEDILELAINNVSKKRQNNFKIMLTDFLLRINKQAEAIEKAIYFFDQKPDEELFGNLLHIYNNAGNSKDVLSLVEKYKDIYNNDRIMFELAYRQALDNNLIEKEEDKYDYLSLIDGIDLTKENNKAIVEDIARLYRIKKEDERLKKLLDLNIEFEEGSFLKGLEYRQDKYSGYRIHSILNKDIDGNGIKENIMVLSNKPYIYESNDIVLVIQNSKTGQVIVEERLETDEDINTIDLKVADLTGDYIKEIIVNKYPGDNLLNNSFEIYTHDLYKREIEYIDFDYEEIFNIDDLELEYLDDFNMKISIDDKQEVYKIRDEKKLIDEDIYSRKGKLLKDGGGYWIKRFDTVYDSRLDYSKLKQKYVVYSSYESQNYFASVDKHYDVSNFKNITVLDTRIYREIEDDGISIYDDFDYKDDKLEEILRENEKQEIEIGKHDQVNSDAGKDEKKLEELKGFEYIDRIFELSSKEISQNLGEPEAKEIEGGADLYIYKDSVIYIGISDDRVYKYSVVSGNDIFGIEANFDYDEVVKLFGEPDEVNTAHKRGNQYFDEEGNIVDDLHYKNVNGYIIDGFESKDGYWLEFYK